MPECAALHVESILSSVRFAGTTGRKSEEVFRNVLRADNQQHGLVMLPVRRLEL